LRFDHLKRVLRFRFRPESLWLRNQPTDWYIKISAADGTGRHTGLKTPGESMRVRVSRGRPNLVPLPVVNGDARREETARWPEA
jgi:hypothetical protein